MKSPYISLIIPVFNEEKRVIAGLIHALSFLTHQHYIWEIILVDDGSRDKTLTLAKVLLKDVKRIKFIKHKKNKGKGAAIKTGVNIAEGKYVMFSDIDFSVPITELPKFIQSLKRYDIAIAVRRHSQALILKRQPYLRELLGKFFTKLANWLVVPGIYDVTCGFKVFRCDKAKFIYEKVYLTRWVFDAEALFIARKHNFSVNQIPITWTNHNASKVHMLHDGLEAFVDLFKILYYEKIGKYAK